MEAALDFLFVGDEANWANGQFEGCLIPRAILRTGNNAAYNELPRPGAFVVPPDGRHVCCFDEDVRGIMMAWGPRTVEPIDVHQTEWLGGFGHEITNMIQRGRFANAVGSVQEDNKIGAVQVVFLSVDRGSLVPRLLFE